MSDRVEAIRHLVMSEDAANLYTGHLLIVEQYAIQLARIENEDVEAAQVAALLHDIGKLRGADADHPLVGADAARHLLPLHGYDKHLTKRVASAIMTHGGGAQDTFGRILSSADGLAHLDIVPLLLCLQSKKRSPLDAVKKVLAKIENEWDQKIVLTSARQIGKERHDAAVLLLKSCLDVMHRNSQEDRRGSRQGKQE